MHILKKIWQHILATMMFPSYWVFMVVMTLIEAVIHLCQGRFMRVLVDLVLVLLGLLCFFLTRARKGG